MESAIPHLPNKLWAPIAYFTDHESLETLRLVSFALSKLTTERMEKIWIHKELKRHVNKPSLDFDRWHLIHPRAPLTLALALISHLTATLIPLLIHVLWLYPKLDLRNSRFPSLRSLTLGRYSFVHDSQLDWILPHDLTIRNLYMENCIIFFEIEVNRYNKSQGPCPSEMELGYGSGDPSNRSMRYGASYTQRWHDYFLASRVLRGTTHFEYFLFGSSPHWCTGGEVRRGQY
ncbi:hypothetical protein PAAG_07870 [Paracoccidioides lutzii Pb01]|uniref:F-box domain-containing protein n=1 Tax=Paracoccidioides lutzii (strain ATCC MYA-826 / Pb01) TaxID=502779 RepID=C1HAP1_PARBA|nr:hypothetical protein PAAG_07870 [Paracoccidioides lutzii Pb01]EEH37452.2 hypothetical protein PAAG_07870 [Paracoccidioides lutzii Pb01]